jgi:diaminohydroxyphosphoribosylaminopyrimidine deaminase/5-amino-6-(5-phosphoribosylamino)uracil reductase
MITEFDILMLHQATRLAIMGHGTAEPNPMVGCIITDLQGNIVGEGFHEKYGGAHAEINALANAGDKANGGTAYVTLEPCNHTGKTPPCSAALLEANIRRVVIGTKDPHAKSQGGAAYLKQHGIDVDIADDELCKEIISPFAHKIKTGLPWITCKWAQTKDGCIETPPGDAPWISCKESQQLVHEERGCIDAIIVGVGTVITDNPKLTVREATKHRVPIRIVIDPTLRIPLTSAVLNDEAPTLIAHAENANTTRLAGTNLISLPRVDGALNLAPLFKHLVSKYDATNIIIEGGATLFQHVFKQQLANELWVFTSPEMATADIHCNMNHILDSLNATLIDEQKSGKDTVARYLVNSTSY